MPGTELSSNQRHAANGLWSLAGNMINKKEIEYSKVD